MKINKGKQPGPRRVLLYGKHGVGKSTWASRAPSPLFLNIEDGLADIECDKTDPLQNGTYEIVSPGRAVLVKGGAT